MNLVRNQIEVVFQAEVGDAFQLLFGPYTAYRVVRAAQHEGFGVWSDALFHVLKVDGVVAVVVDQRAFNQLSATGGGGSAERAINRGENHDFLAWLGDRLNAEGQRNNDARGEDDPILFYMEVVAALHEVDDCLIVLFAQAAVSVNVVSGTFFKCFIDWGRRLKIHIGDPHRQHLLIAEDVPLGAVCAFAVIGFVKVIHFYDLLFRGRTAVLT